MVAVRKLIAAIFLYRHAFVRSCQWQVMQVQKYAREVAGGRFWGLTETEYERTRIMKITSVAVLGAGAVGSYVIWGLADREDIKLGVIAEGERNERLSRQGCAINGKVYHPEVWTPEEAELEKIPL